MADGSWGLSLFVLFELNIYAFGVIVCSWGLSLFVLFELSAIIFTIREVLED